MKKITKFLLTMLLAGATSVAYSQCPNNNVQWGSTNAASWSVGTLNTLTWCIYGGEYRYVYGLQAGNVYSFETCGDYDFDTQITIYDAVTGAYIAYNDDFCGLQSKVTFTSNGNPVRVLVDRFYCGSQSSCMRLRGTRVTGAPAANPCDNVTDLSCGVTEFATLSGSGAWNPPGPWGTPGEEAVFAFTAPYTGTFPMTVTNSGYYVDVFFKTGSCSGTGWTYVDDVYSFGNYIINATAGQTILILIDDENTSTSNISINVSCPPPAADPCSSITDITSCGNSESFSLSGAGAWNPPGPWGTPGAEAVFSYTPPITGAYPITVTNSGYYVDLFYSTSCGPSGWTYVSDIYSNETNTVNLTGGVTYYFLIDDENISPSSGTITVGCPCIPPPGGIDASVTVNSNTSYSSTTIGACNDCSLRSSNDRVLEVNITCPGTYTFSTCGGATWDTYLYLTNNPCSGIIALNDDNCGLQSSITANLGVGTYYLAIEGWSSFSQGAFTVNITKTCNLNATLTADVKNCGYNVSCNGASDGAISVSDNGCGSTYLWSNGATTSSISGLSAGTYSVVVTDQFGCTAGGSVTLTEPDALVVDAGSDQTVYYGYTPMSCADLAGSATGGCPAYNYSWSNGAAGNTQTVCPTTSTDYTLTVVDQNGCTASDEVSVCVIDVRCYAGNSGNQKVEMCHIPPGNPGNAHTICIAPAAVPAHLAHGCLLGDCSEANDCDATSKLGDEEENAESFSNSLIFMHVAPNPFENGFEVQMTVPEKGEYTIDLINATGQSVLNVYSGILESNKTNNFSINAEELGEGIYFLRASNYHGLIELSKIIKL